MAQHSLSPQSRVVLLCTVPVLAGLVPVLAARAHSAGPVLGACAIAIVLALVTFLARAATVWAALTGALAAACCALAPPGWHSSLTPLLVSLVLTLGATRVARQPGAPRHGRTAAQVAANLGVAALAPALTWRFGELPALTVLLAALCEATADTVSSELGQKWGGTPRLITTLRAVPSGTDGAMSLQGTLLGVVAAALVAATGVWAVQLPARAGTQAALAGTAGLLFDSLLGATVERPGWLENDAVNFLSTLGAAALALWLATR